MPQSAIPPGRHAPIRQDWLDKRHEEIIEPELPIVDPHHHMWDRPSNRYLLPDLLADVGSGHNIRATCYEQAREMYRADGPEELKSLGETQFVSGVSAMSASGKYGPTHCITGVIGFVDLRLGSRQGYPRAAHRDLGRPFARYPQRLDLERRPDIEDLHRRRTSRAAAGQRLSRRFCRSGALGSHL